MDNFSGLFGDESLASLAALDGLDTFGNTGGAVQQQQAPEQQPPPGNATADVSAGSAPQFASTPTDNQGSFTSLGSPSVAAQHNKPNYQSATANLTYPAYGQPHPPGPSPSASSPVGYSQYPAASPSSTPGGGGGGGGGSASHLQSPHAAQSVAALSYRQPPSGYASASPAAAYSTSQYGVATAAAQSAAPMWQAGHYAAAAASPYAAAGYMTAPHHMASAYQQQQQQQQQSQQQQMYAAAAAAAAASSQYQQPAMTADPYGRMMPRQHSHHHMHAHLQLQQQQQQQQGGAHSAGMIYDPAVQSYRAAGYNAHQQQQQQQQMSHSTYGQYPSGGQYGGAAATAAAAAGYMTPTLPSGQRMPHPQSHSPAQQQQPQQQQQQHMAPARSAMPQSTSGGGIVAQLPQISPQQSQQQQQQQQQRQMAGSSGRRGGSRGASSSASSAAAVAHSPSLMQPMNVSGGGGVSSSLQHLEKMVMPSGSSALSCRAAGAGVAAGASRSVNAWPSHHTRVPSHHMTAHLQQQQQQQQHQQQQALSPVPSPRMPSHHQQMHHHPHQTHPSLHQHQTAQQAARLTSVEAAGGGMHALPALHDGVTSATAAGPMSNVAASGGGGGGVPSGGGTAARVANFPPPAASVHSSVKTHTPHVSSASFSAAAAATVSSQSATMMGTGVYQDLATVAKQQQQQQQQQQQHMYSSPGLHYQTHQQMSPSQHQHALHQQQMRLPSAAAPPSAVPSPMYQPHTQTGAVRAGDPGMWPAHVQSHSTSAAIQPYHHHHQQQQQQQQQQQPEQRNQPAEPPARMFSPAPPTNQTDSITIPDVSSPTSDDQSNGAAACFMPAATSSSDASAAVVSYSSPLPSQTPWSTAGAVSTWTDSVVSASPSISAAPVSDSAVCSASLATVSAVTASSPSTSVDDATMLASAIDRQNQPQQQFASQTADSVCDYQETSYTQEQIRQDTPMTMHETTAPDSADSSPPVAATSFHCETSEPLTQHTSADDVVTDAAVAPDVRQAVESCVDRLAPQPPAAPATVDASDVPARHASTSPPPPPPPQLSDALGSTSVAGTESSDTPQLSCQPSVVCSPAPPPPHVETLPAMSDAPSPSATSPSTQAGVVSEQRQEAVSLSPPQQPEGEQQSTNILDSQNQQLLPEQHQQSLMPSQAMLSHHSQLPQHSFSTQQQQQQPMLPQQQPPQPMLPQQQPPQPMLPQQQPPQPMLPQQQPPQPMLPQQQPPQPMLPQQQPHPALPQQTQPLLPQQQQPTLPQPQQLLPQQQQPTLPQPQQLLPQQQQHALPQQLLPQQQPQQAMAGPYSPLMQQRHAMQFELQQVQLQLQQIYSVAPSAQSQHTVQELQQRAQYLQIQLNTAPPTPTAAYHLPHHPHHQAAPTPTAFLPPSAAVQTPTGLCIAGEPLTGAECPSASASSAASAVVSKPNRSRSAARPRADRKPRGDRKPRVRSRSKKATAAASVAAVQSGEVPSLAALASQTLARLQADGDAGAAETVGFTPPAPARPKRVRPSRSRKKPAVKPADGAADTSAGGGGTEASQPVPADADGTADDASCAGAGDAVIPTPKKPARPRVRSATSSRRKPKARLAFSFKKKKRRRGSDSEPSDMEKTPPPSPPQDDYSSASNNKRRSGRITGGRKKYVDDLDLRQLAQLSDGEGDERRQSGGGAGAGVQSSSGPVSGSASAGLAGTASGGATDVVVSVAPNFAFINPNDEDSMIVQYILGDRKGKREVIPDSETEDEEQEEQKKKMETEKDKKLETEKDQKEMEIDKKLETEKDKKEMEIDNKEMEKDNKEMEIDNKEMEKDKKEMEIDKTEETEETKEDEKEDIEKMTGASCYDSSITSPTVPAPNSDDKEENDDNKTHSELDDKPHQQPPDTQPVSDVSAVCDENEPIDSVETGVCNVSSCEADQETQITDQDGSMPSAAANAEPKTDSASSNTHSNEDQGEDRSPDVHMTSVSADNSTDRVACTVEEASAVVTEQNDNAESSSTTVADVTDTPHASSDVAAVIACNSTPPQDSDEVSTADVEGASNIDASTVADSASEAGEPQSSTGAAAAIRDASVVDNKQHPSEQQQQKQVVQKAEPEFIEVDEYYVKYKNFSYLHCEWRTEEELLRGDKRVTAKIKRYEQKKRQAQNTLDFLDEELFNPDFIEVDRVLDVSEHDTCMTGGAAAAAAAVGDKSRHFLVKWRSLSYEDCTWELEEDVDVLKIEQFFRFNEPPPKEKRARKKRPKAVEWTKLEESPIYKNNNRLREYQLEGVNWLTFSYYNGHNCILADEMGLGKTIQALTFTKAVFDYGIRGPFLIIAPLSTIPNWQREFESWTHMNIIVYHGSAASRQMIVDYEMSYKDDKGQRIADIFKFNVLITTFEVIIQDCVELSDIPWRLCIIDEAHRLKNANCKLLEGLRILNIEHRVLLSGTPLQNNIKELFSLLNFLEPLQFSSEDAFNKEFGELHSDEQVKKLQALLKPMMLRRLKEDVEKSLAPKEETIIEVELTNIQKKYYRGILEKNFAFLAKGSGGSNLPNLMNTMMELRKCCIHPFLINGAEDQIQHERRQEKKDQSPEDPEEAYYQAMVQSAGKLVLVDKLLPKLRSQGHRVLIFSQMVRMLDILEDYLIHKKYPFERIDGRIRGDLRQAAIDRYSRPDSDRFVFLLCTKAGGLGINLTAADTVIIYDSDWNPQNDLQAQARCHRIGQQKMVKVYRLVTRNTYEREMFDRASLKLGLDKAVLQSMNTQQDSPAARAGAGAAADGCSSQKQLSKKEVEVLLKKGAYGALMDDDTDGQTFCEEDIDQILEKRTQVITIEEEKGSNFSRASFSTAGNRSDIDIDDPDFWNKWAKRAEIEQDDPEKNDLIVAEPRRRARIQRYGEETVTSLNMSDIGSSSDSEPPDQDTSCTVREDSRSRRRRQMRYRPDDDMDFISSDGSVGYGSWTRLECFRVEKQLMAFGWCRWTEIMQHSALRSGWCTNLVQDLCRLMVLQCVRVYRGDEKIRSFMFDLICPDNQDVDTLGKNHTGLNSPVPRGRKSKKKCRSSSGGSSSGGSGGGGSGGPGDIGWSQDRRYNGELVLERSYLRHLVRQANKLVLRLRMLYYIKHEVVGEHADRIINGCSSSECQLATPPLDQPPTVWWDSESDRSLLMGTYKHGYERYAQMRADPALCFLRRCGPPDGGALAASATSSASVASVDTSGAAVVSSPASAIVDSDTETGFDDIDKDTETGGCFSAVDSPAASSDTTAPATPSDCDVISGGVTSQSQQSRFMMFPSTADLNTRLRRLVTAYQRNYKREEQKIQAQVRRNERREKIEQIVREREMRKLELTQKRWSRQDEANFLRVLVAFGVEYKRKECRYEWSRFRMLARLEKKLDDTLSEYYLEFRSQCQKLLTGGVAGVGHAHMVTIVDMLPPPQAAYMMDRVDLMNALRSEAVLHPQLEERLKLCESAPILPSWWTPGKHDRDLIIGAVRHGIGNGGFYILHDPDLSFREIVTRHMKGVTLIDHAEQHKYAEWRRSRPGIQLNNNNNNSERSSASCDVTAGDKSAAGDDSKNGVINGVQSPVSAAGDDTVGVGDVKQEEDTHSAPSAEAALVNGDMATSPMSTIADVNLSPAQSPSCRTGDETASAAADESSAAKCNGDMANGDEAVVVSDVDMTDPSTDAPAPAAVKSDVCDSPTSAASVKRADCDTRPESGSEQEDAAEKDVDATVVDPSSPCAADVKKELQQTSEEAELSAVAVGDDVKTEEIDGATPHSVSVKAECAGEEETVEDDTLSERTREDVKKCASEVPPPTTAATTAAAAVVASQMSRVAVGGGRGSGGGAGGAGGRGAAAADDSLGTRLGRLYDTEVLQELTMIQMLHQSYAVPIQWPSDHALHLRLQHILSALRSGKWPHVDYDHLPADPLDPAVVSGPPQKLPSLSDPASIVAAAAATSRGAGAAAASIASSVSSVLSSAAAMAAAGSAVVTTAACGGVGGGELTRLSSSVIDASSSAASATAAASAPAAVSAAAGVVDGSTERRGRKRARPAEVDGERTKLRALLNNNNNNTASSASSSNVATAASSLCPVSVCVSDSVTINPAAAAVASLSVTAGRDSPQSHLRRPHTRTVSSHSPADVESTQSAMSNSAGAGIDLSFKTPGQVSHSPRPLAVSSLSTITGVASDDVLDLSGSSLKGSRCSTPHSDRGSDDGSVLNLQTRSSAPGTVRLSQTYNSNNNKQDSSSLENRLKKRAAGGEVVGKEKKRRKLDSIISGLSAAKCSSPVSGASSTCNEQPPPPPPLANVSITSVSQPQQQCLPPPPAHGGYASRATAAAAFRGETDALAASGGAMRRDLINLLSPHDMHKPDSKVYNWLESQQHKASPLLASGRSRQRSDSSCSSSVAPLSPSSTAAASSSSHPAAATVDFSKFSPDTAVAVVNRFTGKRLSGSSAPQLKNLAQWLLENPMFDVDPHWPAPSKSSSKTERRKGPGRPPMSPPVSGLSSYSRAGSTNSSRTTTAADSSKQSASNLDYTNLPYGLDPKMLSAYGLDPRLLQADPKTLASLGIDPKMLASMAMDPKMLAAAGLDAKVMASMGIDPKAMSSMGLDPKVMASMGLDPKALASMGLDPKMMASMGLDPKALASMGLDPKMMAAMGVDPKSLPSMGLDPKMMALMGMDPKALASMGLDPKTMASMGLDPKSMASMGLDPRIMASMGLDPKALASMGLDSKALASMGLDPKVLASMGLDPKALSSMGLDPKTLASMGLDPKALSSMGLDPKALAFMGLDPKTLGSMGVDPKLLASMNVDPKTLSNMGMDPKMLASMGLDPKALASLGLDAKTLASMGLDKKSLAAMSSDKKTHSDAGKNTQASADARVLASMGLDPKSLAAMGLDPKSLAALGLDARSLAAMGLDSKALAAMGLSSKSAPTTSYDVKSLAGSSKKGASSSSLDVKNLMGVDPKSLPGMDPKTLASIGLDSKTLASMGLDPKLVNSMGVDHKTLAAMSDPKMLAAMSDPKMLAAMSDPKMLAAMSDPNMLAIMSDPNMLAAAMADQKMLAAMADPKILASMGIDPKAMASLGIDPKTFASLGMDPKAMTSIGVDPKLLSAMGVDSRSGGHASSSTSSRAGSKTPNHADPKSSAAHSGVDAKSFSPMTSAGMDPRLLSFDPRSTSSSAAAAAMAAAGLDPKTLALMDPALLASVGIDPKLLHAMSARSTSSSAHPSSSASTGTALFSDASRAANLSSSPARSTPAKSKHRAASAASAASLSSGTTTTSSASAAAAAPLYGMDPRLLHGLDPRALAALDPRSNPFMAAIDPKSNPYLSGAGLDAKSAAALMDPKNNPFLAGLDPKHPLYGVDPKMLGIDMKNPMMYGMGLPGLYPPGLGLGMPAMSASDLAMSSSASVSRASSKSDKKRSSVAAVSSPSLFPAHSMFSSTSAGAADSMYPSLALPSWLTASSASSSSPALFNGLSGTATVSSTRTKPTASSTVVSDEASGAADRRCSDREKIRSLLKDKVDLKGGLTKEQRNLLKERKRERLLKEQDDHIHPASSASTSPSSASLDLRTREQLEVAERLARDMQRDQQLLGRQLDAKERQLAEAHAALSLSSASTQQQPAVAASFVAPSTSPISLTTTGSTAEDGGGVQSCGAVQQDDSEMSPLKLSRNSPVSTALDASAAATATASSTASQPDTAADDEPSAASNGDTEQSKSD